MTIKFGSSTLSNELTRQLHYTTTLQFLQQTTQLYGSSLATFLCIANTALHCLTSYPASDYNRHSVLRCYHRAMVYTVQLTVDTNTFTTTFTLSATISFLTLHFPKKYLAIKKETTRNANFHAPKHNALVINTDST
jgi:hypothetical protein